MIAHYPGQPNFNTCTLWFLEYDCCQEKMSFTLKVTWPTGKGRKGTQNSSWEFWTKLALLKPPFHLNPPLTPFHCTLSQICAYMQSTTGMEWGPVQQRWWTVAHVTPLVGLWLHVSACECWPCLVVVWLDSAQVGGTRTGMGCKASAAHKPSPGSSLYPLLNYLIMRLLQA